MRQRFKVHSVSFTSLSIVGATAAFGGTLRSGNIQIHQ